VPTPAAPVERGPGIVNNNGGSGSVISNGGGPRIVNSNPPGGQRCGGRSAFLRLRRVIVFFHGPSPTLH